MVPQTQEPGLQLVSAVVEWAGHENPGSKVHHIGVELVDKVVEMIEKIWDPVNQPLCNRIQ